MDDEACANDYGEGHRCHEGECKPTACVTDAECRIFEEICGDDHFCRPCADNYECTASDSYGGGYQCLNGKCSDGDCENDGQCPEDLPICGGNGDCRACQQGENECGEGKVCKENGRCEEGDCETMRDCLDGQLCGENHYCADCVDPTDDDACREQYTDAYLCIESACIRAECENDLDCEAAYQGEARVCAAGNCRGMTITQGLPIGFIGSATEFDPDQPQSTGLAHEGLDVILYGGFGGGFGQHYGVFP